MSIKNTSYFNPTLISGCALWLDGADPAGTGVIPANGSTVTTWVDKSGNGYNFTNGSRAAPTYTTGALTFTGSGTNGANTQVLSNASIPLSTTYSIFAVAVQNSSHPSYTGYNYILTANTTVNYYLNIGTGSSGYFATFTGYTVPTAAFNDTSVNSPNTTMLVQTLVGVTNDNTTLSPYLNGTLMTTKVGTTNAVTGITVGDAPTLSLSAQNWNGNISEIIIFNSVISSTRRQQIEGYLAWKWGLTSSLSSTHPYAVTPSYGLPSLVQNAIAKTTVTNINHPVIAVGGCSLWLDGADKTTTGGVTNVTTWLDKSGNGNTATNQAGAGSITSTTAGLSFNGSGYMYIPGIAGSLVDRPFVIFIVETYNSGNGLFGEDDSTHGSTDNLLHLYYRSATDIAFAFYADDLEDTTISGSGTQRLWAFYLPTASNRVTRRNGSVDVTHTNYTRLHYFTTPVIGRINGGNAYNGIVSEIVIYPSDIGLNAIQQVEGYLAWKWGLTSSLPSGHPYKSSFPLYPSPVTTGLKLVANKRWSPLVPGGCQLWLDASDSSTITLSGSTVTQWRDKSGNGCNTTSIGGTPALTANAVNGVQAIYMNGSSFLSGNNSNTTSTATFFVVATLTSGQGAGQQYTSVYAFSRPLNGIACFGEIPSINGLSCVDVATSLALSPQRNNGNGPVFTPPNYNSGFLHATVLDGTNMYGYGNGSPVGSVASSGNFAYTFYNVGSQTYQLSGVLSRNYYWTGYIGELIAFNTNLGTTQRQQIEGYLAWKWGLNASLPTSHPFKFFPPSP